VTDPKYAAFTALDPFFDIVQQGLAGLVDGDHYFDTIADDAEFEFRYQPARFWGGAPDKRSDLGLAFGESESLK
jgi:hypothetical protein